MAAVINVYELVVYDNDNTRLAYVPVFWGLKPGRRINELDTLSFTVPHNSAARSLLVYPNRIWLYKDGTLQRIYHIADVEKAREASADITVTCQGLGHSLTKTGISTYSATDTPTNHLTDLLALQETALITLGGVDAALDTSFALALTDTNIWEACMAVRYTPGGYLYVVHDNTTPTTWQLWLKATIGEDKGQKIEVNKNLLRVRHRTDYMDYFNKLIAHGTGTVTLVDRTYTRVDVDKSADATYGYLTLKELYAAYNGWTGEGDALPASITIWEGGGGWVSPTATVSSTGWLNPAYSWDGSITSRAQRNAIPASGTTDWLELTVTSVTTTKIRLYASAFILWLNYDVEIYYSAGWHNIYSSNLAAGWTEVTFGEQTITGIRVMITNNDAGAKDGYMYEIAIWDPEDYTNVTADWVQGANENVVRCAIADYNAAVTYLISYTHAAFLISLADIAARDEIYSTPEAFDTDNVDTLLAQSRVHLADIKTPVISVEVDTVDLSVESARSFEAMQLGSIVTVVDGDLAISEEARVVAIEHTDLSVHPEQMTLEISTKLKDFIDYVKAL
jgi:phage minor structural protein